MDDRALPSVVLRAIARYSRAKAVFGSCLVFLVVCQSYLFCKYSISTGAAKQDRHQQSVFQMRMAKDDTGTEQRGVAIRASCTCAVLWKKAPRRARHLDTLSTHTTTTTTSRLLFKLVLPVPSGETCSDGAGPASFRVVHSSSNLPFTASKINVVSTGSLSFSQMRHGNCEFQAVKAFEIVSEFLGIDAAKLDASQMSLRNFRSTHFARCSGLSCAIACSMLDVSGLYSTVLFQCDVCHCALPLLPLLLSHRSPELD